MSSDLEYTEYSPAAGATRPAGAAAPKARIPDCPLARTVEVIGHWWTLEILHEIFDGHTQFDAIQRNLGTPADVLAGRLADLVDRGLLEIKGSADPLGGSYRLTEVGRSLRPVILVLAAWGNRLLAPEDRSLILVDKDTGVEVNPFVVDRLTGLRIDTVDYIFARGPKASPLLSARYPAVSERRF